MIVPSIDLMNSHAVQLVGGREKKIDAGDPMPIAENFGRVGQIAVIDLDAALGQGDNTEMIHKLLRLAKCRVGGGIRNVESALTWLDAGAQSVILGTAATPEVLSQLPRDRVIAALDAENDEVVVEGWRKKTGATILDRMEQVRDYVGGFLVTFVEREGRLGGTAMDRVKKIVDAAGKAKVTIAGGITTPEEIAELDRLGADAQVGMAIYSGRMSLAAAFSAPLTSDRPDGLWPTVVADAYGRALGLAYSSQASLEKALELGRGVYQSRSRGLWIKGETSGNTQKLLSVSTDCDRDALRFCVEQGGEGFCHHNTWTCFGEDGGLPRLARRLTQRIAQAPEGSYTKRLLTDPALLRSKLQEEAGELAEANTADEVIWETADVVYFAMVAMVRAGVSLSEVEKELDGRELKVSRRPGNAKS